MRTPYPWLSPSPHPTPPHQPLWTNDGIASTAGVRRSKTRLVTQSTRKRSQRSAQSGGTVQSGFFPGTALECCNWQWVPTRPMRWRLKERTYCSSDLWRKEEGGDLSRGEREATQRLGKPMESALGVGTNLRVRSRWMRAGARSCGVRAIALDSMILVPCSLELTNIPQTWFPSKAKVHMYHNCEYNFARRENSFHCTFEKNCVGERWSFAKRFSFI